MTTTTKISLVPFKPEHIEITYQWVQEPELRQMFLMREKPNWEGHNDYFNRILKDPNKRIYAIFKNSHHVGNCGFKNISNTTDEGELWIYIGDKKQRQKGFGKIATELLLREGFANWNFSIIYLHVAAFNQTAIDMYKMLGFVEVPLKETDTNWLNRESHVIRMELRMHK